MYSHNQLSTWISYIDQVASIIQPYIVTNTLSPIWFTLDNNTNPSRFSHIYTRNVLLPHIIHYHRDPTYSSLCNKTFTSLRFMIYTHSLDYTITSEHTEILVQTARLETRVPGGASSIPREHTRVCHGNLHHPISIVVQKATLTPTIKRETHLCPGMSHYPPSTNVL